MDQPKTTSMNNPPLDMKAPRRRKKAASLDARKARSGWFFILPFLLGILLIYIPIIIDSIWFSFNQVGYDPNTRGIKLTFEGLAFYQEALFSDPNFVTTLLDGIKQLVFDVPAIVIFSLFVAVILNQKMLGRAAFRAIFFIPVILSTGLMDAINQSDALADANAGGIDNGSGESSGDIVSEMDFAMLFGNMSFGSVDLIGVVVDLVNGIYDIVNRSGVQMLIFLAGLQSISPAIYEACDIEGASAWETFWKITFPMISPMIMVNAIYTIIDSFTSQSNVVMNYISNVYNTGGDKTSVATAMSWMYFGVVMLIIGLFVAIGSAFVFYQKRD